MIRFILVLLCSFLAGCDVDRPNLRIAVASNFSAAARHLADDFQQVTGQEVELITASTGKLVAQISQGAPFDVFLSADIERASRLSGEKAVYALGRCVLWCPAGEPMEKLRKKQYQRLAIANPRHAPYGVAAEKALSERWQREKVVYGENVTQVYQLVASGAADLGCVAYSQVVDQHPDQIAFLTGDKEVRQTMVLVSERGRAFYDFVLGNSAREIIKTQGYDLP